MLKALDNINITDIGILLSENTVLKRFYPLIPITAALTERLTDLKISDKYVFFSESQKSSVDLAEILRIDEKTLNMFNSFLHLYDFKNGNLHEINSVSPELIERLKEKNIKTTKDFLTLCFSANKEQISAEYHHSQNEITRLFGLCDLMRLPGVKCVRADLYYDCNYKSVQNFSMQNPLDMQNSYRAMYREKMLK